MDRALFRSKFLAAAVLIMFASVLASEGFAQSGNQAQTEFTKAFEAGKKLYEDGEHKEAALKFFQALTSAKEKSETVEACFYLSLSYYGLGDSDNAQQYMKKMFEVQPEREIDARLFPAGYVILFYRMKSELAGQRPAKIEEKPKVEMKAEKKKVEEEKKPSAVPGKAAAEPQVKKKGKFPWLIVGGLLVATGVVLYLVLGKKKSTSETSPTVGTISVSSTPSGAKVSLDGSDTGLTSPCTLNNVAPGSHTVKLSKDGYADAQQDVTVIAGQTATVNASLTKNTIAVTSPPAGMIWTKGFSNDIRWQVSGDAPIAKRSGKTGSADRSVPGKLAGRSEASDNSGAAPIRGDRSSSKFGKTGNERATTPPAADPRLSSSSGSGFQTSALLAITKVKIELYKGGSLVSVIIAETNNDGSYSWQTPDITSGGSDYKMRVSCSTDSSIYGESGMFTITPGSITVNEPLSGSAWSQGSTHDIKWTSTAFGNVNIELYKGGSFVQSIVADTPNDGIHTWTIPTGLTDGPDYRIRISTVFSPGLFGESALFTIGRSTYEFVIKWGSQGSGDGQFINPQEVAVDSSGYLYVADSGNHRIQKFTGDGVFVAKLGSYGGGDGQLDVPGGVTVDNNGFIYVIDTGNDRIHKFNSTGVFVAKYGNPGTGDGQFDKPRGIAVDASGNIYVADTNNDRIQKFNSNGAYLTKWGSRGTGDGQFYNPQSVAVDGSGNVYVADTYNIRIQKFNSNGVFLTKWANLTQSYSLTAIAVDSSGNIYMTDTDKHWVQKLNSSGTLIANWGSYGSGDGQFNKPEGIAVDGSWNVYVTEFANHRIQKFRLRTAAPPQEIKAPGFFEMLNALASRLPRHT